MNTKEKKQGIIVKLRENKVIRFVLCPYMNYKRKKRLKTMPDQKMRSLFVL